MLSIDKSPQCLYDVLSQKHVACILSSMVNMLVLLYRPLMIAFLI